ncbi:hypothetical protein WN943_016183 [Citrus x changshan-huyou]
MVSWLLAKLTRSRESMMMKIFPEAKATLRKGASEADIQELEKSLKVKLPVPTRILYRFCDGQECLTDDFESGWLGGNLGKHHIKVLGVCCFELFAAHRLCLFVGVGVRSVDSSHSSVYLLKLATDWESHSVGPTHFWSGEWEWDSHFYPFI